MQFVLNIQILDVIIEEFLLKGLSLFHACFKVFKDSNNYMLQSKSEMSSKLEVL